MRKFSQTTDSYATRGGCRTEINIISGARVSICMYVVTDNIHIYIYIYMRDGVFPVKNTPKNPFCSPRQGTNLCSISFRFLIGFIPGIYSGWASVMVFMIPFPPYCRGGVFMMKRAKQIIYIKPPCSQNSLRAKKVAILKIRHQPL